MSLRFPVEKRHFPQWSGGPVDRPLLLRHHAVPHPQDPAGIGRVLGIMGDHDNGHAFIVQAPEQFHDLGTRGPSPGCRSVRPPEGSAAG